MANSLDKWFDVQSKKIDEAEKKDQERIRNR